MQNHVLINYLMLKLIYPLDKLKFQFIGSERALGINLEGKKDKGAGAKPAGGKRLDYPSAFLARQCSRNSVLSFFTFLAPMLDKIYIERNN